MNTKKLLTQPILMAISIALATTSCNQSYPGLEGPEPGNEIGNNESYTKTPIMMFVNEQDFFSLTATRGMGAFESDKDNSHMSDYQKKNALLYVYSFRNSADTQGPLSSPADLTKTRYAEGKAHDEDNESCLLDGRDYNHGLPVKLNEEPGGMLVPYNWNDEQLYYSSKYQDVGYNFFSYYIDDVTPTIVRSHDKITCEFEVDGTQDVLLGYAPTLTLDLLNQKYGKLNLSAEEKAKIVNANGYSTFAAHRDVHPAIDLDHALTRFVFEAYPGDATASDIKIKRVKMYSKNKCKLTVAAQTIDEIGAQFDDSKQWMTLKDWDSEQEKMVDMKEASVNYENNMADTPWNMRKHTNLGSGLLLVPDEEYKLVLEYEQYVNWNDKMQWRPMSSEYTIKAPHNDRYNLDTNTGKYIYKPGYQYTVKIAVFGLSPIKVTANISAWEAGNDVIIDPDNADNINM